MSATYSVTRDQVIKAAMQVCQALGQGEGPTSTDLTDATLYLNIMLKHWDTLGYKNWLYQTITFPCVANQTSYTIGETGGPNVLNARPVRVPQAYTLDSNNIKIQMNPLSKQMFEMLTPLNQQGPANSYFYDPQLIKGIFYPWPVPTDTSRTWYLVCQRPISDIVNGGDTFDVPQEWYIALVWGLADLAKLVWGTPTDVMDRIEKQAANFLNMAADFSEEDASLQFMPRGPNG